MVKKKFGYYQRCMSLFYQILYELKTLEDSSSAHKYRDKIKPAEMSQTLGYENVYYFSKVFKDYFGMSPTTYKNQVSKRFRMFCISKSIFIQ